MSLTPIYISGSLPKFFSKAAKRLMKTSSQSIATAIYSYARSLSTLLLKGKISLAVLLITLTRQYQRNVSLIPCKISVFAYFKVSLWH